MSEGDRSMRRPALAVRDIEVSSVLDRLKVAIRLTSFEHLVVRITDLESSAEGDSAKLSLRFSTAEADQCFSVECAFGVPKGDIRRLSVGNMSDGRRVPGSLFTTATITSSAGEVLSQRESLFSQTGATPSKTAMATSLAAPAPLGPAAAPVPAARRGGEASVAPRAVEADTRPSSACGGTSSQDGPATPDGAGAAAEGQLPGRKRMRQGSPIASLQSEDHEGGSRRGDADVAPDLAEKTFTLRFIDGDVMQVPYKPCNIAGAVRKMYRIIDHDKGWGNKDYRLLEDGNDFYGADSFASCVAANPDGGFVVDVIFNQAGC